MNKVIRVFEIIFMALSIIALLACLGCFIYSVININDPKGLNFATGVILYFLFSPMCIMASIISLAITLIERLRKKDKFNNITLLYNELSIIFVVVLTVITLLIS